MADNDLSAGASADAKAFTAKSVAAKYGVLVAFALIALAAGGLAACGRWREQPAACLALFLCASCAWIVALVLASRSCVRLRWIVAGAIVLRAIAFASQLELSDDVFRYSLEGEAIASGVSPYAHAPDSPELDEVRARVPGVAARVNHASIPAAYPPLTQAFGALAALATRALHLVPDEGGVRLLRALFGLCDLLVLVPLAVLLRRARRPAGALVAWAWSPLVAFEFAGSAHFDSLGVLLFLCALVAITRGGGMRGTALLAAAVLVKYLPLLAVPWLGRGTALVRRLLLLGAIVVAAFVPFALMEGSTHGLFAGLAEYGTRWQSGSLVHRWLRELAACFFEPADDWSDPERVARLAAAVLFVAWAIRVRVREPDVVCGTGLLVAGFLVLSPTLHPWYLAWVLPFVSIHPSKAWWWLLAVAPLLYVPIARWQIERVWHEPSWMWPLIALPFFALLIVESARTKAHRA